MQANAQAIRIVVPTPEVKFGRNIYASSKNMANKCDFSNFCTLLMHRDSAKCLDKCERFFCFLHINIT